MSTVAPDALASYNQRIHSLDRRVTKVEAVMTATTPHLATKADLKSAMTTQLYWIAGLLIGLATLLYNSQNRMEDRVIQRMDRMEQRFERIEQRFERLENLILQSRTSSPAAD